MKSKIMEYIYGVDYQISTVEDILTTLGLINKKEAFDFIDELFELELLSHTLDKECVIPDVPKGCYLGVLSINKKGFGFARCLKEDQADLFIPAGNLHSAITGDFVLVKSIPASKKMRNLGKGDSGDIIKVLFNKKEVYSGTFNSFGEYGAVACLYKDNLYNILVHNQNGVKHNDVVLVKLLNRKGDNLEGEIIEVLGHKDDVGVDILAIAREQDINISFPQEVLDEVSKIPNEVLTNDKKSRLDLTSDLIITVDGADSKDLDDAICIKKLPNGNFKLGVHIADVSHYVKDGTRLDDEAKDRATSVYLVDRVIPMLPKELSNGICSLNPQVERLTLSCFMEINSKGNVVDYSVHNSVIKSKYRMTYDEVYELLEAEQLEEVDENKAELLTKYKEVIPMLKEMKELQLILRQKRTDRGGIDFDFPETKVIMDNGKPVEIKPLIRNYAHFIIEEFMIVCNETIAEMCAKKDLPFVYRVHEQPNPQRVSDLFTFTSTQGLTWGGANSSVSFQKLLEEVKDSSLEKAINMISLRTLSKAKYFEENLGHFGLASQFYCHFTSPIRRYPDLQIHRIIKQYIGGYLTKSKKDGLKKQLPQVAKNSSSKEVTAQRAEMDSVALKKAEFMKDKVGEIYTGVVSGVMPYGCYVSLENTVEGLIHVSNLKGDRYELDEENYCLVGKSTGKKIVLGQELRVKLSKVNVSAKKIDFEIV